MLYTIVMEFASPTFLGVPLSLSIVIWCAVGGRQSLLGAMLGAIVVVGMQGTLSESETFLETWTLVMGFIFVLVVLFMPKGLAGAVAEPAAAPANAAKKPLDATEEFNLHELETRTIRSALAAAHGNRTHAAELLGVSRRTLQRKLKILGI